MPFLVRMAFSEVCVIKHFKISLNELFGVTGLVGALTVVTDAFKAQSERCMAHFHFRNN